MPLSPSELIPLPLTSLPGIQRDGTPFDSQRYIDGLWTRFYRNKPRKMGGYRAVTSLLSEKVYGMRLDLVNNTLLAHLGSESFLQQVRMTSSGLFSALNDRTPVGFTVSPNNLWQLDSFYDTAAGTLQLIAHAGQNLNEIANETEFDIYAGDLSGSGALTVTGMDPVSGGVCAVGPYLIGYGTNGRVDVSAANDFSATAESSFQAGSKIVKGFPVRGTGNGPGALLWSLDSLIRAQFLGGAGPTFGFDQVSGESSILSSQGVIEYNSNFYWVGLDSFLMFNGVIREIENDTNLDWFFNNLNFEQRQKVFVYKVPRFGEIWWCFPYGSATECTHAVIYNVRGNFWYDTELPATMRTAGAFAKVYQKPFMCDGIGDEDTDLFTLWQHESGTDLVKGIEALAIQAKIRTREFSMLEAGKDAGLRFDRQEPDFVQAGPMTVRTYGRANAKSEAVAGEDYTLLQTPDPANPQTQVISMKEGHRIVSIEFESNVSGGNFQMGKSLGIIAPQDMRYTGS